MLQPNSINVILIGADWCGACKTLDQGLPDILRDYAPYAQKQYLELNTPEALEAVRLQFGIPVNEWGITLPKVLIQVNGDNRAFSSAPNELWLRGKLIDIVNQETGNVITNGSGLNQGGGASDTFLVDESYFGPVSEPSDYPLLGLGITASKKTLLMGGLIGVVLGVGVWLYWKGLL